MAMIEGGVNNVFQDAETDGSAALCRILLLLLVAIGFLL